MKAIRQKNHLLAAFTGLGVLISVLIFVWGAFLPEIQVHMLLPVTLAASGCAAGLWVRGYGRLKAARLIVENQILHIRPAVISDLSAEAAQPEEPENTEVLISYFGVLLDAKIIKFNQDGIRLRAVEIGDDFISFTYGTEKRTHNIRLLRPAIDPETMQKVCERFRYETGITPTIRS